MTVSQLLSVCAILHACLKAFLLDSEPSTATSILLYLSMTTLLQGKRRLYASFFTFAFFMLSPSPSNI